MPKMWQRHLDERKHTRGVLYHLIGTEHTFNSNGNTNRDTTTATTTVGQLLPRLHSLPELKYSSQYDTTRATLGTYEGRACADVYVANVRGNRLTNISRISRPTSCCTD
eukprot:GFYU01037244.1.p2 GENE.GFYU01037244.1~~GFYU01037244.1.p2  ORF type:complete len:109 (+),score=19.60 GFYU01037244.1:77-403(+)